MKKWLCFSDKDGFPVWVRLEALDAFDTLQDVRCKTCLRTKQGTWWVRENCTQVAEMIREAEET